MKRAPTGGFTHGASGYSNYDCRCHRCRAGHAAERKRNLATRRARLAADPTLVPHGRESTYGNWGCRCRHCTDAYSSACYERVQRRMAGAT